MYLLFTKGISAMRLDGTISLGNLLTFVGMLIALYGFHISNVKRIMTINFRVNQMWNVFKKRFNISDESEHMFDVKDNE